MKVYVVMEHYSDYDEGSDTVVSIHHTKGGATKMMHAADMAVEDDYIDAFLRKGEPNAPFLWGRYDNYHYEVVEWDVEP